MTPRIALAYSGGLQSLAAIRWLAERHRAEVVTVTVDIGQGGDLAAARDRARAAGAARSHVLDAREEFMSAVAAAVKADALGEGCYPMATSLGRAVVASRTLDIARIEDAAVVAHGSVGRDRDRMDTLFRGRDPSRAVLASAAEHGMDRVKLVDYVGGFPDPALAGRVDENLWGRTIGFSVDDPAREVPGEAFTRTRDLSETPDRAATIEIEFECGVPVAVNGVRMSLVELAESLSTIAGEHGLGRLDRLKRRADGTWTRVAYEAPAAVVVHRAHVELLGAVLPADVRAFAATVSAAYAELIGAGQWFSPLRAALDGFVDRANEPATGTVHVRLFKGNTLNPRVEPSC
jgi:argininosuccinate synthase